MINVSGHRIGTAEVESALVGHPKCAEAAVVPVDHPIKGQAIYAFVTLMGGIEYPPDESVRKELGALVGGWMEGCRGVGGGGCCPRLVRYAAAPVLTFIVSPACLPVPALAGAQGHRPHRHA